MMSAPASIWRFPVMRTWLSRLIPSSLSSRRKPSSLAPLTGATKMRAAVFFHSMAPSGPGSLIVILFASRRSLLNRRIATRFSAGGKSSRPPSTVTSPSAIVRSPPRITRCPAFSSLTSSRRKGSSPGLSSMASTTSGTTSAASAPSPWAPPAPRGPAGPCGPTTPWGPWGPRAPRNPVGSPTQAPFSLMTRSPPTLTDRGVMSPTTFCATFAWKAAGTRRSGSRGMSSSPSSMVIPSCTCERANRSGSISSTEPTATV